MCGSALLCFQAHLFVLILFIAEVYSLRWHGLCFDLNILDPPLMVHAKGFCRAMDPLSMDCCCDTLSKLMNAMDTESTSRWSYLGDSSGSKIGVHHYVPDEVLEWELATLGHPDNLKQDFLSSERRCFFRFVS